MVFHYISKYWSHKCSTCFYSRKLNLALLWSGCRNHIGKIILSCLFTDQKIEVYKSPDISLYTRFQKNYDTFPHTNDQLLSYLDISELQEDVQVLVANWKHDVLKISFDQQNLIRDDYKKIFERCILFLTDQECQPHSIIFKRPRAMHKARWMAKFLHSIKICLFEKWMWQLPKGTITQAQQPTRIRGRVKTIQTRALLRSARILRRVLETWGDLLSLGLQ